MAFKNTFSVGIIGPGKTGLSLAEAFLKTGNLAWVLCRSEKKRQEALKRGITNVCLELPVGEIPDVIFITVQDRKIEETATELFTIHRRFLYFKKELFKNTVFIHCSGALRRNVLKELENISAGIAAAHPFQTFPRASDGFLKGIAWGIEAEEIHHEMLAEIITVLKGKPIVLTEETLLKKELYHISAVAASNFLAAAIASARDFAKAAGIDEKDFLPAIIQTAVNNSLESISLKNGFPLTGPIARGDTATVERHVSALKNNPDLLKEYQYFSLATAEIAFKNGIITAEIHDELEKILKTDL
jgi:predicted short-subunit dehydrogenase-like oxidoreductase (DUF2520 family)